MRTVKRIIDPQTIQLSNGKIVSLVGIRFPDFNGQQIGDLALTAQKVLKDMLEQEKVILHLTPKKNWGRTNRMGHTLAHLERERDGAWVQGALLRLGLAQVMTGQRNPELAEQMYALEETARKEKLGIWEQTTIINAEDTPSHINSYQIIEGRVESVANKNNRIYINFGKDWRTDFTISIKSEDKRHFSKRSVSPLSWGGKNLRVRGWIGEYNGPYVNINHPEAVQILTGKNKTPHLPGNKKRTNFGHIGQ